MIVDNEQPALYRLSQLRRAETYATVFICESERDCDALHERLLIATSFPGGLANWQSSVSEHFRSRNIVILSDDDQGGDGIPQT